MSNNGNELYDDDLHSDDATRRTTFTHQGWKDEENTPKKATKKLAKARNATYRELQPRTNRVVDFE